VQFSKLRIGQKGLLLIGVHLTCEVVFFAALTMLLYDANAEQQRQFEAKNVLLRTSQLALCYERSGHYLLMWSKGHGKYKAQALAGIERLKQITTDLEKASSFDPILNKSFQEHKPLMDAIFVHISKASAILRLDQPLDFKLIDQETTDLGDLTHQFGDWQDQFVAMAEHIEIESPQKQEQLHKIQYAIITFGLLANLIITLILFRFFSTSISRRLTVLEENTVRFGLGTALQPLVDGKDEIHELDVTFHNMASQIEQSRRRQRALSENTADMIFSVSEKMRLTEANEACNKSLAVNDQTLLGGDLTNFIADSSRKTLQEQFAAARATNQPVTCEVVIQNRTLEQFETSWTISWSEPELSWFCVARNITEQKRLERLRQDFIAMITHDMRSPLTSILSNLQMLRKGAYGALEQKGSDKTDIMIGNCRQLLAFINDLLDVDRLESGGFELDQRITNADALIEKSIRVVEGAATSKSITLSVAGAPGVSVIADESRISQVLVNLISNAIKFSNAHSTIQIGARQLTDRQIQFIVKDNGRGIPAEKLPFIFERYKQSSAADAKGGSGFGLGLYICQQLLKAHGSSLSVTSKENEGSAFTFTLQVSVV
jgi:PAS domain S-box-containing protein